MYEWKLPTSNGDNNCPFPDLVKQDPRLYVTIWYQFRDSDIPDDLMFSDIQLKPEPGNDKDKAAFIQLRKIKDNIDEFVEKGLNLFIGGRVTGTGKTSWGIKLLKQYIYNNPDFINPTVVYVSVPEFISYLSRVRYDKFYTKELNDYINKLKNCDLLLFDDIGFKPFDDYIQEVMYNITNFRANSKSYSSTIYTSNKMGDDLLRIVGGDLLYSRIYTNCRFKVSLEGHDRRGDK
ncbi:MAG: ATP-binding protein [Bacilli bacterium]